MHGRSTGLDTAWCDHDSSDAEFKSLISVSSCASLLLQHWSIIGMYILSRAICFSSTVETIPHSWMSIERWHPNIAGTYRFTNHLRARHTTCLIPHRPLQVACSLVVANGKHVLVTAVRSPFRNSYSCLGNLGLIHETISQGRLLERPSRCHSNFQNWRTERSKISIGSWKSSSLFALQNRFKTLNLPHVDVWKLTNARGLPSGQRIRKSKHLQSFEVLGIVNGMTICNS